MKKYKCWIWNPWLNGWVLSPGNTVQSDRPLNEMEEHFRNLYPENLIRVDVEDVVPIITQLSLF